ncbi:hypothetical protein B0H19DRAFT_1253956 [Mycena capillaripes]|nr:hypothetical protein B0H19DRAFT_1253956 [Mycena capillaripes]
MLTPLAFTAILAVAASANHRITLRNNCPFGVGMTLSNFPHNGVDYTGPAIPDIPAFTSHDVIVPTGWNGRICDHPPNSGCQNDCFGGIAFGEAACSMTEWTFDSPKIGGQTDYDISNIQGFSVAQQIIPDAGCSVVTCTSVNCACNQETLPGLAGEPAQLIKQLVFAEARVTLSSTALEDETAWSYSAGQSKPTN